MFRSEYEIELENTISEALTLLRSSSYGDCEYVLEEQNNRINELYEKEFE